jgi:hypothetical protein
MPLRRPQDHCNTLVDSTSRKKSGMPDARRKSGTTLTTVPVEDQGTVVEGIVVEEGAHQVGHRLERPPVMSVEGVARWDTRRVSVHQSTRSKHMLSKKKRRLHFLSQERSW